MRFLVVGLSLLASAFSTSPQQPPQNPLPARAQPQVSRLGPGLVGIGAIRVNTATRELRVPGKVNQVTTLEFLANPPGGLKEYESAVTVEADAISFNTALLLLGLDATRATVPRQHLDPNPPAGDPVEILVEWRAPGGDRQVRAEELLWNQVTRTTVPVGPWVYTGSRMVDGRLLADVDGVLIGFVHSPAPLIEHPGPIPAKSYGDLILNPNLQLLPGLPMTLVVRALDRTGRSTR